MRLVVTGRLADVPELAAITFTEAAAAELRHRVRERLERAAASTTRPASVSGARIDQALDRIDEATITTLHGFAARLLADFPVEAGLPPGFEVADEIAAEVIERERWAELLDDLFADPELEPVLRRALQLGPHRPPSRRGRTGPSPTTGTGCGAWSSRSTGLAPVDVGPGARRRRSRRQVRRGLRRRRQVGQADAGRAARRSATGCWPRPIPSTSSLVVAPRAAGVPEVRRRQEARAGRAQGLRRRRSRRPSTDLLRALRLDALEPLLIRLRDHTLAGVAQRRHDGQVRFHDLLVLARDLLVDHEAGHTIL